MNGISLKILKTMKMKTVFDLKTELQFDVNAFEQMKDTAKGLLSGAAR